jgi:hypothetical protein
MCLHFSIEIQLVVSSGASCETIAIPPMHWGHVEDPSMHRWVEAGCVTRPSSEIGADVSWCLYSWMGEK